MAEFASKLCPKKFVEFLNLHMRSCLKAVRTCFASINGVNRAMSITDGRIQRDWTENNAHIVESIGGTRRKCNRNKSCFLSIRLKAIETEMIVS